MTCEEIMGELQSMASEKYKENVVRMGIPRENSIGVSTPDLRGMAKKIKKSNQLAFELWETGYHEARLLAVLLFDKKQIEAADVERLMTDVISWDLCDHLCKNLILKLEYYDQFIDTWIDSGHTYKKRAAFTLMAAAAVKKKNIQNEEVDRYLRLIYEKSDDEREHVKKAASWALREIGKKDFDFCEKAILTAHELRDQGGKAQAWIAKDALKELETLVKAEGRQRLISSASQMGKATLQ